MKNTDSSSSKKDFNAELRRLKFQDVEEIIQGLQIGIIIYDVDGNVLHMNQCAEVFFQTHGIDKRKPFVDRFDQIQDYLLNGQALLVEEEPVYRALIKGETVTNFEVMTRKTSGEYTYTSYNCSPIKDSKGKITGAILAQKDITDRVYVETALHRTKKQALDLEESLRKAESNKMELINILSHEFRNPLTSAMIGVELLEKNHQELYQVAKVSEVVRRQLKHLKCMMNDLIDMTHVTNNQFVLDKEQVDLNSLARQTIRDYQWQIKSREIVLLTEFSDPLYLEADPIRMSQAIGNLLHNAIKFTEKGGRIFISVSRSNRVKEALVTVRDTGIGMDKKTLANLFEPFLQADKSIERSKGGLGLGLSIVKGIVTAHGGYISVKSDGEGKGTQAVIRLPIINTEEINSKSDKGMELSDSLRILLIDDMLEIREIMTELLEHLGHEVVSASNGQEGIKKAKEFLPHVLLCDIGLPGINGYEVAEYFSADDQLKNTCMIAFSGYSQPKDRERSKKAGFKEHLSKPVELETLQRVLFECAQQHK